MAGRSRGGLFAERCVQPLPALEEPYALAFSVTRERFKLAASNGFPLDGRVCAVQSGLILLGAARNLHRMGAHADIHDCGRDRLRHFLGRMEERLTLGTFLPLLRPYCSRLRYRFTGEREPLIKIRAPILSQREGRECIYCSFGSLFSQLSYAVAAKRFIARRTYCSAISPSPSRIRSTMR